MMRYMYYVLVFLIALSVGLVLYEKSSTTVQVASIAPPLTDVSHAVAVDEPPYQHKFRGTPFEYGEALLEPSHEFIVTARVLSRKDYSDSNAKYIPTDLALGWGRMADKDVTKGIDISQRNRWFYWKTQKLPIPKKEIIRSAANMHLIPADANVQEQIDAVKKDDIVQISGKLVDFTDTEGRQLKTSTTRNDTGGGACEIIFVESLVILE